MSDGSIWSSGCVNFVVAEPALQGQYIASRKRRRTRGRASVGLPKYEHLGIVERVVVEESAASSLKSVIGDGERLAMIGTRLHWLFGK